MATEIRATLEELKGIAQEIYSLNKRLKELRLRKKECDKLVVDYLEANDKPGLKLDNIIFMAADKSTRARKKKDEVIRDSVDVLKRHGVSGDPAQILEELIEARRGETSKTSVLKMKAAGMFA